MLKNLAIYMVHTCQYFITKLENKIIIRKEGKLGREGIIIGGSLKVICKGKVGLILTYHYTHSLHDALIP